MTAEPLDAAVARFQKGMRIHLDDARGIQAVQSRLTMRGEGEVSLVLRLDGGDRRSRSAYPAAIRPRHNSPGCSAPCRASLK